MAFPYFGALLGFFGGFAFAPTTYFVSMQIFLCTNYESYNQTATILCCWNVFVVTCRCLALFGFLSTNQKYLAHLGS